jgi:hypothetical protein
VRASRHPAAEDNPFSQIERHMSATIVETLEGWTKWRDSCQEAAFFAIYGSPVTQALAGINQKESGSGRRMARELSRDAHAARLVGEPASKVDQGGAIEGALRAVIHVRMAEGQVDERALAALRKIAAERGTAKINLGHLKRILREQYQILRYHEAAALAALPKLLPEDSAQRADLFDLVRRLVTSRGVLPADAQRRLGEIERLFGLAKAARSAAE